jgi:hypothetical protein
MTLHRSTSLRRRPYRLPKVAVPVQIALSFASEALRISRVRSARLGDKGTRSPVYELAIAANARVHRQGGVPERGYKQGKSSYSFSPVVVETGTVSIDEIPLSSDSRIVFSYFLRPPFFRTSDGAPMEARSARFVLTLVLMQYRLFFARIACKQQGARDNDTAIARSTRDPNSRVPHATSCTHRAAIATSSK